MAENINREEPRVLEYRKHVKFVAIFMKYFVFLLFIFFIYWSSVYFFHYFTGSKILGEHQVKAIGAAVTWLILYLEYIYLLKSFAISKIQVFQDHILIQRGKKEVIIPFNEITQVQSAVQKHLGGWFKLVLKNGKTYRFAITLERVDYVLDAVIAYNQSLLEKEKYHELRTSLIIIDHGFARFYSYFGEKYRWITAFLLLFLPIGFTMLLFFRQSQLMVISAPWVFFVVTLIKISFPIYILMIVAPIVINRIVNKKIQTRLQQDPNNKLRDVELEGTAYHKVLPFCLLGLLSFYMAVYHFDLNTLTFSRPMVDVPHLQLHQAETVFVDNRFNCLRCNYSLKREDRIVFKKENGQEFLGRLIGVPGEVVQINNKGTDGRYIASTEEIKIPEGKVAVRVNPDGSALTLVNVDQIRGRITTDLSHFLYPSIKDKY